MSQKYESDLLSGVHKMATRMFKSGNLSPESMEEFNRLCLPPEDTGVSCVPDIMEHKDEIGMKILARKLNVSLAFVFKLFNGRIEFETIPNSFFKLLVRVFGVPQKHMEEYLASDNLIIIEDKQFNTDEMSETDAKQSFEKAIDSSELSNSQRSILLSHLNLERTTDSDSGVKYPHPFYEVIRTDDTVQLNLAEENTS